MKITNKDLAKRINLKPSTFYGFIKRHPEILDLVKKGLKYEDLLDDLKIPLARLKKNEPR